MAQIEPTPVNPKTDPDVPQVTVGPAIETAKLTPTPIPPLADPEVEYYQQLQAENEAAAVRAPLTEPPGAQDEFSGIDTQIAANENGLQEPPQLSDEEVNAALAAVEVLPPPELDQQGNIASVDQVRSKGILSQAQNTNANTDWRLKIKLAPQAKYFYNSATPSDLMWPLRSNGGTDGVIFPYTPTIAMNYRSYYEVSDLIHTNYKQYFYKNSSVEEITITADFTAQDTQEANYMLAVMTFFRSATKMFYGQDGKVESPINGTPPPLCYMVGYGQFQFNNHPVLITSFQYNLPNDVDYIRAGSTTTIAGDSLAAFQSKTQSFTASYVPGLDRLFGSGLKKGGQTSTPTFNVLSNPQATYVPTKIQFTVSVIPIVTRGNIAKQFSLRDYATGGLIKKGYW